MSYIRGQIDRIIHSNGSFYIVAVKVEDFSGYSPSKATATGHVLGLDAIYAGTSIELVGEWTNHARYGRQFKIRTWSPWAKDLFGVKRFLASHVRGFGDPELLDMVTNRFGLESYNALTTGSVYEVAQNEQDRNALDQAVEHWNYMLGVSKLCDSLQDYNLGANVIASLYTRFGLEASNIIEANPYRLMEVEGVSFQRADNVAFSKKIASDDSRRLGAGLLWAIREYTRQGGHLFVRRSDVTMVMNELAKLNKLEPFVGTDNTEVMDRCIEELVSNKAVIFDPNSGLYTESMYQYERGAADMLSHLSLAGQGLELDLNAFIVSYEKSSDITLSEQQKEALIALIKHNVLVITGAPGTGKTTIIRAFVQLFKFMGREHMLMAPTGIAAKRLSTVTETPASTIHRALKYDGFSWGFHAGNTLSTQAVIVDELSMVDQELLYRLLSALEPSTMVVLVGDDAQLPSVGPGNVLRELIACPSIPTVRLSHVFRQAETSDIVLAAHAIRRGRSPLELPKKADTEFQFVPVSKEEVAADLIVKMAVKLRSKEANFQVLSPKYDGVLGVDNLNELLRDAINPDVGQEVCDLMAFNVRIGDRLMVIKNNYRLNVYNGDIGKLIAIEQRSLVLKIHGVGKLPSMTVKIPVEQADAMLKLAYAVTVHRCQGEEFDTVILPLSRSHGRMLQRNLVYTAITRAKQKVYVLGDSDAVLRAVDNDKVQHRNTMLRYVIRGTADDNQQ